MQKSINPVQAQADRTSASFHHAFDLEPGQLFGIEQEYEVSQGGQRTDFLEIIHKAVNATGNAAGPAGSTGYYLRSGTLLICDGWDAEVAAPPEIVNKQLFQRIPGLARNMQIELLQHLHAVEPDQDHALTARGYSTHLSTSCTGINPMAICKVYARTMAPLMMLLLDHSRSPGLIIRPRQRRFEVGGDYIGPDDDLRTASLFFVASFLAVLDAVVGKKIAALPLHFDASKIEPTYQRCGLYTDRSAFGEDLYTNGRTALLNLQDGKQISVQLAVESIWDHVKPYAENVGSAQDLELLSQSVLGIRKFPSEHKNKRHTTISPINEWPPERASSPHPFAASLETICTSKWKFKPEVITWDFIVYLVVGAPDNLFLNIPRNSFAEWLNIINNGSVDNWFETALDTDIGTLLNNGGDAEDVGIYTAIDRTELIRRFEGRGKKKKKREDPLCDVLINDDGSIEICMPQVADSQVSLVEQEPPQSDRRIANGVWVHNGSFTNEHADHRVRSRGLDFEFLRYYRSGISYSGPLGLNWDHAYNARIVAHPPTTSRQVPGGWCEPFSSATKSGPLTFYHGTGRITFHAFSSWEVREVSWCNSSNFVAIVTTYKQNDGESFEIQRYAIISGSPPEGIADPVFFRIMHKGGTRFLLNCHGRLLEVRDRHHNKTQCRYGLPFDPGSRYFVLRQVIDSQGRKYSFNYSVMGGTPRIVSLMDPWQRQLSFEYDADIQLEKVNLAQGDAGIPTVKYRYGGQRGGILRHIVNPVESTSNQQSWLENTYDIQERVITQRVGSTASQPPTGGTYRIAYPGPLGVILTDRAGVRNSFSLKQLGAAKIVDSETIRDQVGTSGVITSKLLKKKYEYDQHYHMTRVTYPGGMQETFKYRNQTRPVRSGEEFDDFQRSIAHHNDLGRDALSVHVLIGQGTDPSFTTRYEYDWLFCSVTKIKTPTGSTDFTYANSRCATPQYNGNPTRIKRPDQRLPLGGSLPVVDELDYAPGGILKFLKDPDGIEHSWVVNTAGQIKSHTVGGEIVESYDYDARGNVVSKTDNQGKLWKYDWDDRDLQRTATDPLGHLTTFSYNLNDFQVVSTMNRIDDPTQIPGIHPQAPTAIYEVYEYDLLGNRITHTQMAAGGPGVASRVWRWTLDAEERLILLESPRAVAGERSDAKVRTSYNARGLVRTTTTADGGSAAGTVRTYYDEDSRVAMVIDEVGGRTISQFDSLGRPVSEKRPNGTIRHLDYRGPRLWREWIEGPISTGPASLGGTTLNRVLSEVQFQVDAWQRPITRTTKIFAPLQRASIASSAGGSWIERTWLSGAGRINKQRDPAGHEALFKWNAQGRLDAVTMPGGHTLVYRYEGELVSSVTTTLKSDAGVTGPIPPTDLVLVEKHKYDALGRNIRNENAYGVEVEHAYDSMGNIRAKRSPTQQGQFVLTQFEYDLLGRKSKQITDSVASVANPDGVMKLSFQHDLNDNIIQLTDDIGRVTKVSFDGRDLQSTLKQPHQADINYRRRRNGAVRRIVHAGGNSTGLDYSPGGAIVRVRHSGSGPTIRQFFGYDGLNRKLWGTDSSNGAQDRVQSYRNIDSLGRILREQTVIPEFNYDQSLRFDYATGRRRMHYPDNAQVTHKVGGDGNTKQIRLSGHGVILDALHQGPGRVVEQKRNVILRASQPMAQRWNLTLRTSQRYDPQGRLNFRVVHVSDPVNRPTQPGFIPLMTESEAITYEVNGMPRTRNYGVITQPGTSVDSTFVYDGLGRARIITEGEGQDFINFDYDWDGVGRLHLFEINGRQGGQIFNERTTMQYQNARRVDQRWVNSILENTSHWDFDTEGKLQKSQNTQPAGSREFNYDSLNRLRRVNVITPGTFSPTLQTSNFLYDAFGRIAARMTSGTPEFFLYDGTSLVAELDAQSNLTRRYIYDERQQLVHYGFRDQSASWRTSLPLVTDDGSPWILLDDRPSISALPTPPGATAGVGRRSDYYRQSIPLILEEHRWRPFEKGKVIQYTYSGGSSSATIVDNSMMPIDSGGRRYFPQEKLFANGPRFYDPALRTFIVPDELGAWGHPMAFGNPYSYAGNNPLVFGDNGNHPAVVGVLIVVGIGVLIGASLNVARQGVQLLEGSRDEFSWTELGFSALLGGTLAPAFVFAPELAVPLALLGAGSSVYQYNTNQIGGATLAFDLATLAIPFAFKGVRSATLGKGTHNGRTRGLGPVATFSERAGRFTRIGRAALARFNRPPPAEDVATLNHLRELRALENEPPVAEADLDAVKGDYIGSGRQGEVFELVGSKENLALKMFDEPNGAMNNLGDIEVLHLAMMNLRGRLGPHRIRIPRIHSIGRTNQNRSFMIRERVMGDLEAARPLMEGPGIRTLTRMVYLMEGINSNHPLPMDGNVILTPEGVLVVFDL